MRRREFTSGLIKAAAATALSADGQQTGPVSLRDAGARKNLSVGSAVSFVQLQQPAFTRVLSEQASIVVSENDMKWESIHPEQDRFDFRKGDALVAFAAQRGQQVRGHNLCWHKQLPAWFQQVATPQNAVALLRGHIAAVAGHYAGRIHSWDVVNEAIAVEDGRPDGLRNSIWLQLIGPQYIEIAFRAAAQADPHAILTYNDYDLEQDSPVHNAKRRAVLQLLTSMRERNVPFGALGLQSHLKVTGKPADWTRLHQFLEQLEKLNHRIFVTELDVDDTELPADIGERDRAVAELYGDYLKNVLRHRSVDAVLTWGLTDRATWLNSFDPRKDALPQRPLPFDSELKPKPAFHAMLSAIENCPSR